MKKLSALLAGILVLSTMSPLNAAATITGYSAPNISGGGGGNNDTYHYYYDLISTYDYVDKDGNSKQGWLLNQNVIKNGNFVCKGEDTVGYRNACKLESSGVKNYTGGSTYNNTDFLPIEASSFDKIEGLDTNFQRNLIDFIHANKWQQPGYDNAYRMLIDVKNSTNRNTQYFYALTSSMLNNDGGPDPNNPDIWGPPGNPNQLNYKTTIEFGTEDSYKYYWQLIKFDSDGNSTNYTSKYSSENSQVRFDKPIEYSYDVDNIYPYYYIYDKSNENSRKNTFIFPFQSIKPIAFNSFFKYSDLASQIDYNTNFEYHLFEERTVFKTATVRTYKIEGSNTTLEYEEKFAASQRDAFAAAVANQIKEYNGIVYDEDTGDILVDFREYEEDAKTTGRNPDQYLNNICFSYLVPSLMNPSVTCSDINIKLNIDLNNSSSHSITLPDIKLDNWVDLKSETFINQNTPVQGKNFEPKFSATNIADQVNNRIINGNRITASDIDTSKILTQDLSGDNLNIKLDSSKRPSYDFTTLSDNNAKHIKLGFNGSNFGVDNSPVEVNSIDINGTAVGTQFDLVSAESQPKLYVGYQQTKDPETMTIKTDSSEDTDGAYVYNPTDSVDIGVKSMKYDDVGRPLGFSTCETNFWFTIPRVGTINEVGFNYEPSVPVFLEDPSITHDMIQEYKTNGTPVPTNEATNNFNSRVKNNNVIKKCNKVLLTESYIQPVLSGDVYTKDAAGNN